MTMTTSKIILFLTIASTMSCYAPPPDEHLYPPRYYEKEERKEELKARRAKLVVKLMEVETKLNEFNKNAKGKSTLKNIS